MFKEVCFSARTSQIPFVKTIAEALRKLGVESFYQEDISLTGSNWQTQWFLGAKTATKIVCIITSDYPLSEPCCEEFGVAKNQKKLIVVYKDSISSLSDVAPKDFNGAVLMYLENRNQGLPSDDVDFIAQEVFKAVRGSPSAMIKASAPPIHPTEPPLNEAIEAARRKYGINPLLSAAEKEDKGAVKELLAAGYKDLEEKDSVGDH